MGRKQNENLIPITEQNKSKTREEISENARKAGIASGIARREKKTMLETLEMFMSMPLKEGQLADLKNIKSIRDVNGQNISVQEGIVMAQVAKALKGDIKSAQFVAEMFAKQAESETANGGVQIVDDY